MIAKNSNALKDNYVICGWNFKPTYWFSGKILTVHEDSRFGKDFTIKQSEKNPYFHCLVGFREKSSQIYVVSEHVLMGGSFGKFILKGN